MKKQPSNWEKIFANEATNKVLTSKIHKELIQRNTKRTNNPIKKWEEEVNRHFSKGDIQIVEKYMKKCSTSLIILRNENQDYNEVSPHTNQNDHHQKKSTNNKHWRGYGKKGTLLHCWWECKLVQPLWRTIWRFLKNLKIELPT